MAEDNKPEVNDRVGRLIDAATEHVKKHGLQPATKIVTRTGRVSKMGRNVVPIRPTLPGLPGSGKLAAKGSFISMDMNDDRTRVKMIMTIDGVATWVILNKEQLARFMIGCGDTLKQMVEEK